MQQPFQVVLMASLSCPGDVAGPERLLDPVEQALGDERLVLALVTGAAPLHNAEVEGVGQEPLPPNPLRIGLAEVSDWPLSNFASPFRECASFRSSYHVLQMARPV